MLERLHMVTSRDSQLSPWARGAAVPVLLVTFFAVPALVPIGIVLVVLQAVLRTTKAIAVTHREKSLWRGFQFGPALVYM